MLEPLAGFDDRVVAFKAVGTVSSADYGDTLSPAIERATAGGRKARMLYLLGPEFHGFDPGAVVADAVVGLTKATAFDRIAVVTDHDWLQRAIHLFGGLIPGEVRVFAVDRLPDAEAWIRA